MIRKLWLESNTGKLFKFDETNHVLVKGVTGLGLYFSNNYIHQVLNYTKVSETIPLTNITFTLVFLNGYQGFNSFLSFVGGEKTGLKLKYKWGNSERYVNVELKEASKGELLGGAIVSEITLEKTSMWLNDVETSVMVDVSTVGKVFPFTYPFTFSETSSGSLTLVNNGVEDAPAIIEIEGAIYYPRLDFYSGLTLVTSLHLLLESTDESTKIMVSSHPDDLYIKAFINGAWLDIYDVQDFDCDNFCYIPKGTVRVEFLPGVLTNTTCKITYTECYYSS
jgi:hypothetical protein